MSQRVHPELIWANDISGAVIGPVHLAIDLEITQELQGAQSFNFRMLPNDPKLSWVDVDRSVSYGGEVWRVLTRKDVRSGNELYVEFSALPTWYDLGDDVRFGPFVISGKTIREGIEQILRDTQWTVGAVPENIEKQFSYENANSSILELLRGWSAITDCEIEFVTQSKTVVFREKVGVERGIGFRYGRNLQEIAREYKAPEVTRIYPIGANEMDIGGVNGGVRFVEDFSWYTSQGMTTEQAREQFLKEWIWTDERFLLALNLKDAAVKKLEALSHPTISYECRVVDLSRLTGLAEDQFGIGDTVRVQDDILGVDIRTRIVKLIKRPYEPWNNEIELSYLRPGIGGELLTSISSTTGTGGGGGYQLLVYENTSPLTIATSMSTIGFLNVTTSGEASGTVDIAVSAIGSGSGTLVVGFYVDSTLVGGEFRYPFTEGTAINVSMPNWFTGLEEGVHLLSVRARVEGSGTVAVPQFYSRFHAYLSGLLGGGGGGGGNVTLQVGDTIGFKNFRPSEAINRQFITPNRLSGSEEMVFIEHPPTEDDIEITTARGSNVRIQ